MVVWAVGVTQWRDELPSYLSSVDDWVDGERKRREVYSRSIFLEEMNSRLMLMRMVGVPCVCCS